MQLSHLESHGIRCAPGHCSVRDQHPIFRLPCREKSISRDFSLHDREYHAVRQRECLPVQVPAANDHDFFAARPGQCILQRMCHLATFDAQSGRSADDDILPSGERSADGFPCLAAHDDGLAHGRLFEMLQFPGKMPRHFPRDSDYPVCRHGRDQRDGLHCSARDSGHQGLIPQGTQTARAQTDIGALIAG